MYLYTLKINMMQQISMVDLKSQYKKISTEIDAAIKEVIDNTAFINGKAVSEFAEDLQSYLGVKHVLPCANGTDALQIALMALGLEPGDEVITSPFTFIATAEVINLLRLKPVFVDVYEDTFNLNVDQLEAAINQKTKCIIPVHLFGQTANMEAIMEIANKHNIAVVEDNAQAIGADYTFENGSQKKAGTIGHIGCTSFFPSKNLGCFGDGGAIFTNDDKLAEKIKVITNHGSKVRYYHDEVGVNSRLDSIQAAVLKVKLKHLDEYIKARQNVATIYNNAFADLANVISPVVAPFTNHVFHQYTLKVKEGRDELQKALQEKGLPAMIYYPIPLHLQKAYTDCGYVKGDFPVSEQLALEVISLPMHTELDEEQLNFITQSFKEALLIKL